MLRTLTKRFALYIWHHIIKEALRLARIVKPEDVRMIQTSGNLYLSQKPIGAERRGKLGMQHFERDQALVLHILSEIDGCHPAATELTIYRVVLRQCGAEALDRKRSGHIPARIDLKRGVSLIESKSGSCSIQSLWPYPLSIACSRAVRLSSIRPSSEYVQATL